MLRSGLHSVPMESGKEETLRVGGRDVADGFVRGSVAEAVGPIRGARFGGIKKA